MSQLNVDTIGARTGTGISVASGSYLLSQAPLLHLQHKESSGTNGGTNSTGSWQTRTLNTEVTDEIGSTLSSNQFTLPAGTYYIDGWAVAFRVNNHKSKLKNITDSSDEILGSVGYTTNSGGTGSTNMSFMRGRFTITDTKTFEIQTYTQTQQSNTGLGESGGSDTGSTDEIYVDISIVRIS